MVPKSQTDSIKISTLQALFVRQKFSDILHLTRHIDFAGRLTKATAGYLQYRALSQIMLTRSLGTVDSLARHKSCRHFRDKFMYIKAFIAVQKCQFDRAAKLVDKCIRLNEQNLAAKFLSIKVKLVRRKIREAESEAVSLEPDHSANWEFWKLRGLIEREKLRLDQAASCFKRGLECNSSALSLWLKLGDLSLRQHRYAEAEGYYRRALDLNGRDPKSWLKMAYLFMEAVDFAKAERCLLQARRASPRGAQVQLFSGIFHFRQSDYSKAKLCLDRARQIEPSVHVLNWKAKLLHAFSFLDEADTLITQTLKTNSYSFQALVILIDILVRSNNREKAQEYLEKFSRLDPDHPSLLLARLKYQFQFGLFDRMQVTYSRLQSAGPLEIEARYVMGLFWVRSLDLERAKSALDGLEKVNAKNRRAIHLRIVYLLKQGQNDKAREAVERGLKAHPKLFVFLRHLAEIYIKSKHNRGKLHALRAYMHNLHPNKLFLAELEAEICLKFGLNRRALALYLQLNKRASARRFRFEIGVCHFRMGKMASAAKWLRSELRAAPTNARAKYYLGKIHLSRNELRRAIEIYSELLKRDPGEYLALLLQLEYLVKTKKHGQALSLAEKLLSQNPKNVDILTIKIKVYWRKKMYAEIIETVQIMQTFTRELADVNYFFGMSQARAGNPAEAIPYLRAEQAKRRPKLDCLTELLECYARTNRLKCQRQLLEFLVEKYPGQLTVWERREQFREFVLKRQISADKLEEQTVQTTQTAQATQATPQAARPLVDQLRRKTRDSFAHSPSSRFEPQLLEMLARTGSLLGKAGGVDRPSPPRKRLARYSRKYTKMLSQVADFEKASDRCKDPKLRTARNEFLRRVLLLDQAMLEADLFGRGHFRREPTSVGCLIPAAFFEKVPVFADDNSFNILMFELLQSEPDDSGFWNTSAREVHCKYRAILGKDTVTFFTAIFDVASNKLPAFRSLGCDSKHPLLGNPFALLKLQKHITPGSRFEIRSQAVEALLAAVLFENIRFLLDTCCPLHFPSRRAVIDSFCQRICRGPELPEQRLVTAQLPSSCRAYQGGLMISAVLYREHVCGDDWVPPDFVSIFLPGFAEHPLVLELSDGQSGREPIQYPIPRAARLLKIEVVVDSGIAGCAYREAYLDMAYIRRCHSFDEGLCVDVDAYQYGRAGVFSKGLLSVTITPGSVDLVEQWNN